MKILKKAVLPDGTHIQLEDWNEDFSLLPYGATIAAYPKRYLNMRAAADFRSNAEAETVFAQLINRTLVVADVPFTVMERGGRRVLLQPILEKRIKLMDGII